MQSVALTHTLSFGLTITTGEPSDLHDGCLEARRIRNETNRLDKHGECRLHVTVTHEHAEVADKHDADTSIGVDVNEDCIAVAAMSTDGHLEDSVVFEYTEVKTQRHEFFTKRKRMQTAGQTAVETVVQTEHRLRHADEPSPPLVAVLDTPRAGVVQRRVARHPE